jgi:hypothetical protein
LLNIIDTVSRAIKELGRSGYKMITVPKLNNNQVARRLQFARWWRKNKKGHNLEKIMFSDEKMFTVNGGLNKQNQIVYAESREHANQMGAIFEKTKYPMSVMIWCGLTFNGATEPYVLAVGESVTSNLYQTDILPFAKSEGNRLFGCNNWMFQQDGATAHTAKTSQQWCRENFYSFIEKDRWPPNSPDLNPLDYYFWNSVVTRMKKINFNSKESFVNEIKAAIKRIPIDEIRKAIKAFSSRLRNVEEKNGEFY